jgi:Ferritin-like
MANGSSGNGLQWDLPHLQAHLQDAVDFEFWTIPYYLAAMYSIRDPASEAFQLIQSVVNQEMLHLQLVCNLSNAFGRPPEFKIPLYGGPQIPHLDFRLDVPDPTGQFMPYSTEIGPLDQARINTMCLIEYPEWLSHGEPELQEDRTQYASIGDFYDAIRFGISQLQADLRGGVRQVDFFSAYYNNLPTTIITANGNEGYQQAIELLDLISEQGEGRTGGDGEMLSKYRETSGGIQNSWTHYRKFKQIRDTPLYPRTFKPDPEPGPAGLKAQQILVRDFANFIELLNNLFAGKPYHGFGAAMARLGGEILNCWQHNAVPKFS